MEFMLPPLPLPRVASRIQPSCEAAEVKVRIFGEYLAILTQPLAQFPAMEKEPPTYTSLPFTAMVLTVSSVPLPSEYQTLPSHLAIFMQPLTQAPALEKLPPA